MQLSSGAQQSGGDKVRDRSALDGVCLLECFARRHLESFFLGRLVQIDSEDSQPGQDARDELIQGQQQVRREGLVLVLWPLNDVEPRDGAQLGCDSPLQVADLGAVEAVGDIALDGDRANPIQLWFRSMLKQAAT
jgi:hypothetical protein